MVAIGYLERNDFSCVAKIGSGLLHAKDGNQSVFVFVDPVPHRPRPLVRVPKALIELASGTSSRVDVIAFTRPGQKLVHVMNVVGGVAV